MLKKLFGRFMKDKVEDNSNVETIFLSKIDKHMNFILRDNLGHINKSISEKIIYANQKKEETIVALRTLHKANLMNSNIPEREIQIMDGNRDNYIKKISQFTSNIEIPKNYLEAYDYCVKFSLTLEQMSRDVQKNIFVLQHFFSNEVRDSNKALHELEEVIIEIRVLLEKNGIIYLKDIQKDIKEFTGNVLKIKSFKEQISSENGEIDSHQDKLNRLNDRIKTITTGTDYRALETFRQEKGACENELKEVISGVNAYFSPLETALKKYYYMNPDKKIIKAYLDDLKSAIIDDKDLSIVEVLKVLRESIMDDKIDLKDRKKEQCIESIDKLSMEYLKNSQSQILRLEEQKQRAQVKITHNSASLNLSEQQYWINATQDKMKYHHTNIEKLEKNINIVSLDNAHILGKIRTELEKLMNKDIDLKDDLTEDILKGEDIPSEQIV